MLQYISVCKTLSEGYSHLEASYFCQRNFAAFSFFVPGTLAGAILSPVAPLEITVSCDSISVVFGESGLGGYWYVDIYKFGEAIPHYSEWNEGSEGFVAATFVPPLTEGDQIVVEVELTGPHQYSLVNITVSCSAKSSLETQESLLICRDGRLNVFQCEPLAIYPIQEEEAFGMVIYRVNRGNDAGIFSLEITAEDIAALPESVEEACVIAASEDAFAVVYLLPTGEIQINAGPDEEGKIFVYRFETFPSIPAIETYFSEDSLPTSPSC